MGVYHGVYENKCPRCGEGDVYTTFISVSPMSYAESCSNCKANDFNEDEVKSLGDKLNVSWNADGEEARWRWPDPALD